ncbi:MerR family transcriptional regulator [Shewanella zhangzhouensis]|uniref:MerR family transcriptional regulator n=1 Tax=Shewanella zhangzhouensis TaxID=2864213 RepID=UPI001C6577A8|nr:MerR family transcriptional regulator [Shewanella zhangzhouensis]QYK04385.1 MerR family transcriptional regulator [Shewanella zhangzhouensis]
MYIGEAARVTGLSIKAIRFYEQKGLLPAPKRHGRYRVYSSQDLELLRLIRDAKALGVPLTKLTAVVPARGETLDWPQIRRFLEGIKLDIRAQQLRLEQQLATVDKCLSAMDDCPGLSD